MRYINVFLALLILVIFSIGQLSGQEAHSNIDSLIHSSTGTHKLGLLQDAAIRHIGTDDFRRHLKILEKEARAQGNADFTSTALMLGATHYHNGPHTDSFFYYASLSNQYSLEHGFHDRYFAVESYIVQRHIYDGNHETALEHASRMLAKAKELGSSYGEINAYECIGLAYVAAGQPAEAIGPLEEGFSLLEQHLPDDLIYIQEYALNIVSAALAVKEHEVALEYCGKAREALEKFHATKHGTRWEGFTLSGPMVQMETAYAACYMYEGRIEDARGALQRAQSHLGDDVEDAYMLNYDIVCAEYYNLSGDNVRALEYLDKAEAFASSYSMYDYIACLELRAKIAADTRNFDDAYLLIKNVAAKKDSLSTVNFTRQISEIRTLHQVDKLEMEASAGRAQYRSRLTLAIVVAALALSAFAVILYFYRRKRAAYAELVRKSREWAETVTRRTRTVFGSGAAASVETEEVMAAVTKMVIDEKGYKDPEITLVKLSETTGINRTYISKAINEIAGQNFNSWINDFRIKEAVEILLDPNFDGYSMEGVAYEVGFNNRTSFYEAFRRVTGLSPADFRRNRS